MNITTVSCPMSYDDLIEEKLENVGKVYDVDYLLALRTDPNLKPPDARLDEVPYSLFHAGDKKRPAKNEKELESGPLESVWFVERMIKETPVQNVVEFGAGMNGDALYLAMRYPHVYFYRVTATGSKLEHEVTKFRGLKNYQAIYGEYETLREFRPSSVDLAYSVESLSLYPKRKEVVTEMHRVLGNKARFITIDGYLGPGEGPLTKKQLIVRHLVGRGKAINEFETYADFTDTVHRLGFDVEIEEDVTDRARRSLERREHWATRFFETPAVGKIVSRLTPTDFAYSVISNYLAPVAFEMGMVKYMVTVFKKR